MVLTSETHAANDNKPALTRQTARKVEISASTLR